METSCGCTGIRTCLICEEKKRPRKPTIEPSLTTLYMCPNCGRIFSTSGTAAISSSPPLQLCSPLCTSGEPVLHAAPELKEVSVVKDFVTEEEERSIVAEIDSSRWAESQSGRKKQVS